MEHFGKTSALTHQSTSGLAQVLTDTVTQLLPLRDATVKCIMLTARTVNESLQANSANIAS